MGRKAREWRLTLFVAGEDYDLWRDRLIRVLDEPGPGTLVHPYLGTFRAVATDPRWRESTRAGGICTFEVTFAEAEEIDEPPFPVSRPDTRQRTREAADALEEATIADFAEDWDVEGLLGGSLAAIERDLLRVVRDLEDMVGDIAGQIAAEIRAPKNIAGIVIGGYERLKNAALEPVRAANLYNGSTLGGGGDGSGVMQPPGTPQRTTRMMRSVAESGESVELPDPVTPERIKRRNSILASRQLSGRAAAVSAARLVADTDWSSRQAAQEAGTNTLALIDDEMLADKPVSRETYAALQELRVAVSEDLRTRATALPEMTTYTPMTTLPAVVIAQVLYGDARRADEITIRNDVRHPGAVRGGMALEVLSE
jgi:prophage DNA circulation protein